MNDVETSAKAIEAVFLNLIAEGADFHCNVIDRDYRIVWHNRVAGDRRRPGLLCHEFYQSRAAPCRKCPVREVFSSGEPCVIERERLDKLPGGLPRWGEIRAFPIRDEGGSVRFVATIGFDITEKRLRSEESRAIIEKLQDKLLKLPWSSPGSKREGRSFRLTRRELQVLPLIAEGFSNIEIAAILGISNNTVKSHLMHIFNKLGAGDRTEAAIIAARKGLI